MHFSGISHLQTFSLLNSSTNMKVLIQQTEADKNRFSRRQLKTAS